MSTAGSPAPARPLDHGQEHPPRQRSVVLAALLRVFGGQRTWIDYGGERVARHEATPAAERPPGAWLAGAGRGAGRRGRGPRATGGCLGPRRRLPPRAHAAAGWSPTRSPSSRCAAGLRSTTDPGWLSPLARVVCGRGRNPTFSPPRVTVLRLQGREDLLALLPQLRPAVRRTGRASRADTDVSAVRHRGLGQPHLGFRERELPAALAPAGSARP